MMYIGDEPNEEGKNKCGSGSQKDRGGDISSILLNLDDMDMDMVLG